MLVSSLLVGGLLLSTSSAGDPLSNGDETADARDTLISGEEPQSVMALEESFPSFYHKDVASGQLSDAAVEHKAATLLEETSGTSGPDANQTKAATKSPRRRRASRRHGIAGTRKGKGKDRPEETTDQASGTLSRVFTTAKRSVTRMSHRMYAKGEDYWRDPRRRRALGYFAVVAVLMIIVAYAQHRENIFHVELEELEEQRVLVKLMEEEVSEEAEKIQGEMAESEAAREAQREEEKSLQMKEEELRMLRDMLRDRAAALQQEQIALSIREAKAELSAAYDAKGAARTSAERKGALEKLRKIKEEANKVFWEGPAWLSGGDRAAMSDLGLLEAEVRAKYHTILRVMALEDRSTAVQEQVLRLKEDLRDSMCAFETQVRAALRTLADDAWVAEAEKKILKSPQAKFRLLRGLEAEWEAHAAHHTKLLHSRAAERRELAYRRKQKQAINKQLLEDPEPIHKKQLGDRLFALSSMEVYQEGSLRLLDAEVGAYQDKEAWMDKMKQLLEEAEARAQQRVKSWATPAAAKADSEGKIKALQGLMESLEDKVDMCSKIQKTWREAWKTEAAPEAVKIPSPW